MDYQKTPQVALVGQLNGVTECLAVIQRYWKFFTIYTFSEVLLMNVRRFCRKAYLGVWLVTYS